MADKRKERIPRSPRRKADDNLLLRAMPSRNRPMNWNNLKSMKCPKCGKALKGFIDIKCQDQNKCKFTITSKRFDEVVKDLYTKGRTCVTVTEEENLSKLNNL